jgi:N-glycosylase/DNA lyase
MLAFGVLSDTLALTDVAATLQVKAAPLYDQWTRRSDRMARIIGTLPGLRIVRQDPVECLFSFICSSNNNIQRIQQMVDKLRATYGDHLITCDSTAHRFHAFPTIAALATECEDAKLRELGFGYRAPFVIKTARQLQALGGVKYLLDIRDEGAEAQLQPAPKEFDGSYQDQLMVFAGVGRKVADCVALFSLERLDAIPVDTHVWQIACREFDASLAGKKSITPGVYKSVGEHFRSRFTPFAGWAHSVLFAGDLTVFQPLLADVDAGKDKATKKKSVKKKKPSTKDVVKEEAKRKRPAGSTRSSAPGG